MVKSGTGGGGAASEPSVFISSFCITGYPSMITDVAGAINVERSFGSLNGGFRVWFSAVAMSAVGLGPGRSAMTAVDPQRLVVAGTR